MIDYRWLRARNLLPAIAALWSIAPAHGAADEIIVFTDELERKGNTGHVAHLNYATRTRRTPDYIGEQPPDRVFRLMPEMAWGFADRWNLGVHVPLSLNTNANIGTVDGLKLRLHYLNVIERGADGAVYYGANYEFAIYSRRITESRHNLELRSIVGLRHGGWKFTLNPILNQALSRNPSGRPVELEVFGQAIRDVGEQVALGVEHFASLGRLSKPTFGAQSGQTSYLVVRIKLTRGLDLQLGVGHGWTAPVDRRVFKALIALPF
jgi:hypothetical protein